MILYRIRQFSILLEVKFRFLFLLNSFKRLSHFVLEILEVFKLELIESLLVFINALGEKFAVVSLVFFGLHGEIDDVFLETLDLLSQLIDVLKQSIHIHGLRVEWPNLL